MCFLLMVETALRYMVFTILISSKGASPEMWLHKPPTLALMRVDGRLFETFSIRVCLARAHCVAAPRTTYYSRQIKYPLIIYLYVLAACLFFVWDPPSDFLP